MSKFFLLAILIFFIFPIIPAVGWEPVFMHYGMSSFDQKVWKKPPPFKAEGIPVVNVPFYAPGEFEPAEGALFCWDDHQEISRLLCEMIRFIAEEYKVFIRINPGDEPRVRGILQNAKVNLEQVKFIPYKCGKFSAWIGDYGPTWIYTQDGKREIIDLYYPDPADDNFNQTLALKMGVRCHPTKFFHLSSDLIFDSLGSDSHGLCDGPTGTVMTGYDLSKVNNVDLRNLEQNLKDLYNADKVGFFPWMLKDLPQTIDSYLKLLDPDFMMLGIYAGGDNSGTATTERSVSNNQLLAEAVNDLHTWSGKRGKGFQVLKVLLPGFESADKTIDCLVNQSYTTCLVVGRRILLPNYGNFWDETTMIEMEEKVKRLHRSLEQNFEGYLIKGFNCQGIRRYFGTLHSLACTIPVDPLEITHEQPENSFRPGEPVLLTINVRGINKLNQDKVTLYYRVKDLSEVARPMSLKQGSNGVFEGVIKGVSYPTTVTYHFRAEDMTGMYETLPEGTGAFSLRFEDPAKPEATQEITVDQDLNSLPDAIQKLRQKLARLKLQATQQEEVTRQAASAHDAAAGNDGSYGNIFNGEQLTRLKYEKEKARSEQLAKQIKEIENKISQLESIQTEE
ncbi:MAG: agmatine deiminase family protein [Candidatus Wallbacteria bacterium]|nr:agmatine deiminase family protein [Candidatus Wallbacteria bacterium]